MLHSTPSTRMSRVTGSRVTVPLVCLGHRVIYLIVRIVLILHASDVGYASCILAGRVMAMANVLVSASSLLLASPE
jgi:hypothetical protein